DAGGETIPDAGGETTTTPTPAPTTAPAETIALNWSAPAQFTYDGKDHAAEYKAAEAEGLTLSYTITKDGAETGEIKDAGTYVITANVTANEKNATVTNTVFSVVVEKAVIAQVQWSGHEGLVGKYNASEDDFDNLPKPKAAFTFNGKKYSLDVTLYEGEKVSNNFDVPGTYSAKAAMPTDLGKNFDLSPNANKDLSSIEIAKPTVNIIWTLDGKEVKNFDDLTYNGKEQVIDAKTNIEGLKTNFGAIHAKNCEELSGLTVTASIDTKQKAFLNVKNDTQDLDMKPYEIEPKWDNLSTDYTGEKIKLNEVASATFTPLEEGSDEVALNILETTGEEIGTYRLWLDRLPREYDSNYTFKEGTTTADFEIKGVEVAVNWTGKDRDYNGKNYNKKDEEEWSAEAKTEAGVDIGLTFTIKGVDAAGVDMTEPGEYVIKAVTDNKNVTLTNAEKTITISKAEVELEWQTETTYNGEEQFPEVSFTGVDGETHYLETEEAEGEITPVNVGAYRIKATLNDEDEGRYQIPEFEDENDFEIKQLEVEVMPVYDQLKLYGQDDPEEYEYTITEIGGDMDEEAIIAELADGDPVFDRDHAEDLTISGNEPVGSYPYKLHNENGDYGNFKLIYEEDEDNQFEIQALPIIIVPASGQQKTYGEKDPEVYNYSVEHTVDNVNIPVEGENSVKEEIGNLKDILLREAGETPGTYNYDLAEEEIENYKISLKSFDSESETPVFTINPVQFTEIPGKINTRDSKFSVKTNINAEKRDADITTDVVITVKELPTSGEGTGGKITVDSKKLKDYIANAAGIDLSGDSVNVTIAIKERYHLKSGKTTYSWSGGLPAGTKLTVDIVDRKTKNSVVKETKEITVEKATVAAPVWAKPSIQSTDPSKSGYYIVKQGESLQLANASGEYVLIAQGQKNTFEKSTAITYDHGVGASDQSQIGQTVTANLVDTWNLVPQSDAMNFYVDNGAIQIPASAIQYSNRDDKMTITLPEYGAITSVTIPNGTVTVDGSVGTQHTCSVSFSGTNLITTGSAISVTYKDEAGYETTSGASAARSTVNTPINFNIRPNVNPKNYLNMAGGYDSLLVSGSACSCEPIKVTIAGNTLNTFATQNTVWSDSTGNFDVTLPLGSIPDGDFSITAEYVDVNGTPMTISALYDSYCASPAITSPIYEAMYQMNGLVEPNSTVIVIVNGDTDNVYTVNVDRFGHFSMDFDSVNQALFAGDYFDIQVIDIAGNTYIRHVEIEEPGDPFEVSSKVQPLGKFFYSADEKEDSTAYMVTPVSTADFTEDENTMELPLLFGATFEVGTMTLTKTEQGLTVASEIDADVMDDSTVTNEKLYVFTQKPTLEDIKNHTNGTEYKYGDVIPMAEGATLWILDEKDMTIDEIDGAIEDLDVYEFDATPGTLYAKFQEA
ncbi:MAG: hypothetical protein Q4B26_15160, partial [Eubacteriales bacterium]|nr:hypothetical protein [Eubacteriales bacterium]